MIKYILLACLFSFVCGSANAQEESEKEKYHNRLADVALSAYKQSADTINEADSITINLKLGKRDVKKIFKHYAKMYIGTKSHFRKEKPYYCVQIDHYWIITGKANWWKPKHANTDYGTITAIIDARNGAILRLRKER